MTMLKKLIGPNEVVQQRLAKSEFFRFSKTRHVSIVIELLGDVPQRRSLISSHDEGISHELQYSWDHFRKPH